VTSGIYRIDLGNDWFYIGSAVNFAKRKKEHRTDLKRKVHCNNKMQNCWNKYRVFNFIVLEECAKDYLIVREQFYLDQHFNDKKNVNLAPTAGSPLGYKHSTKARENMSIAQKGRVISVEHRAKISASHKLRAPHSAETRAKMSASQKGRIVSAETRAKMVAAWVVRKAQAA